MKRMTVVLMLALSVRFACAGEPVTFTTKPAATKDGDQVKVSFAASAPTDVAVYVEDANGRIVRHLAGGALGKNAPEPLQPDSLQQSIVWNGKDDDGVPAASARAPMTNDAAQPPTTASPLYAAPFHVRVGLGLKASYAGHAFAATNQLGPNMVENVLGLTAGPDGKLYVLDGCGGMVWGGSSRVLVFRRDGAYERAIKPFPSTLPVEKARGAGAFTNAFGGFNPLIQSVQGLTFYPVEVVAHQPAMTADGQLVLAMRNTRLAILARDGGIPHPTFAGPVLGGGVSYGSYPVFVAAADSKSVYAAGLASGGKSAQAIYRVQLPERTQADVWFGDAAASGSDHTHLKDVRGLALDDKGHLFIADFGNDRVLVLNEKDKSVAATVPVKAPLWVGVNGKSGALYVQSIAQGTNTVIKFANWEKATEVARLELKPAPGKNQSWRVALDTTAEPAVLWAALGARLVRSEDPGDKLAEPVPADCYAAELYWRPTADPTRREVLCRKGGVPGYGAWLEILDEESGKIHVFGKSVIAGKEGRSHRLGPDGGIYIQDHAGQAGGIMRLDRNAEPNPFPATIKDPFLKGRLPVGTTGTTMWERDFSVDRKGYVYVRAAGPEYHGLMTVHIYDPQGNLQRIVLQTVSDGMYGPRLDLKGNLYIMDSVKAPGQPFPEEFKESVAAFPSARDGIDWIYGSVMKFSPAGGAIWYTGGSATPLTYEGWGSGTSIAGLRTTGGSLTGTIAHPPAALYFPSVRLDAAVTKKLTMRLKNDSAGAEAKFGYHRLRESYTDSCGPGFSKSIEIKPNSDFTEYTFDLSDQKDWRDIVHKFTLIPTTGDKGSFSLDWVRFGEAGAPATNAWDAPIAWNFDAEDAADKKLASSLKKEKVGAYGRPAGAELQGALWWRAGYSPLGDMSAAAPAGRCHCTASDFDVDDFGRVFLPDTGRFRVGVLDANGNEILSFGGYGNQDCNGPESYVVDPVTKLLRPRKVDDPKDLLSPAAKPEIGFAWIIGLAVTDKYAYISDVVNKRVLRVKLDYTEQAMCEIR